MNMNATPEKNYLPTLKHFVKVFRQTRNLCYIFDKFYALYALKDFRIIIGRFYIFAAYLL